MLYYLQLLMRVAIWHPKKVRWRTWGSSTPSSYLNRLLGGTRGAFAMPSTELVAVLHVCRT